MSEISISRRHDKSIAQARASVDKVAGAITKKFAVEHAWSGDVLSFSRSGVEGSIALARGQVKVHVRLGFLLGMMRGPIEQEIERVLDEEFG
jgi:putative polyhydroxyalkanoate system protein